MDATQDTSVDRSHLGQIHARLAQTTLDLEQISVLRTELGDADFIELAETFISEIRMDLDWITRNQGAATAAHFHGLRGAASNLGLRGFCDICHGVEARNGGVTVAELNSLAKALDTGLAALVAHMPDVQRAL